MALHDVVNDPIPFPDAFQEAGDSAAQSQAAVLLSIGALSRFEEPWAREPRPLGADSDSGSKDLIPEEDREVLNLPLRHIEEREWVAERLRSERRFPRTRLGRVFAGSPAGWLEEQATLGIAEAAQQLAERQDVFSATTLCWASLDSPDPLVRVAAASAALDLGSEGRQDRLIEVLVEGTYQADSLVRDVAATALSRVYPGHPRLVELIQPAVSSSDAEPSHTATVLHGTWARSTAWWQPGGDFHRYLSAEVDPTLYSAADRFDWSGGYSDEARSLGALDLLAWVREHDLDGLDLFAHSHGGSVAMLASRGGLRIGRLVLLSCPNHMPKYEPDFARVGSVVSIRVRMDLVILADGGEQKFNHPNIREIVLPIWFKHSTSHEPQTWIDHDLPSKI